MKAAFYHKETGCIIDLQVFEKNEKVSYSTYDEKQGEHVIITEYTLFKLLNSPDFEFIYSNNDELNWEDYLKLYHIVKYEKSHFNNIKDHALLLDKLLEKSDNLKKLETL